MWPGLYFIYSLIHGAITAGTPTASSTSPRSATQNNAELAFVIVLLLSLGAAYVVLDRRLDRRRFGTDAPTPTRGGGRELNRPGFGGRSDSTRRWIPVSTSEVPGGASGADRADGR